MPAPTAYTFSGVVAAPIEKVFDLLTDPTRIPDWLPTCHAVTAKGDALFKGERFSLRIETPRRATEIHAEVIDYTAPTTFGWAELGPRRGTKTFFKLQFGGGSTEVTMKHVWTPGNWRAWLIGRLFRRRNAHRMFDGLLQNLRKALTR